MQSKGKTCPLAPAAPSSSASASSGVGVASGGKKGSFGKHMHEGVDFGAMHSQSKGQFPPPLVNPMSFSSVSAASSGGKGKGLRFGRVTIPVPALSQGQSRSHRLPLGGTITFTSATATSKGDSEQRARTIAPAVSFSAVLPAAGTLTTPNKTCALAAASSTPDELCFSLDEATCPICFEIISGTAFETECCGKLTCESCAQDCRIATSCFHCRRNSKIPDGDGIQFKFRKSHFATRMFRQMKVNCKECSSELALKDLESHMHPKGHYFGFLRESSRDAAVCPYARWKCPHSVDGCGFAGGRLSELKTHLAKGCTKGFRKHDAKTLEICGGEDGLMRSVKTIHGFIAGANPIPPDALMMTLSHLGIQLTATVWEAVCSMPRKARDRLFVELEQGQLTDDEQDAKCLIGSPSWCRVKKCPELLSLHFLIGLGDVSFPVLDFERADYPLLPTRRLPTALRKAYRSALQHFVVDKYNLPRNPVERSAPSDVRVAAVGRECITTNLCLTFSRSIEKGCTEWATLQKEKQQGRSTRSTSTTPSPGTSAAQARRPLAAGNRPSSDNSPCWRSRSPRRIASLDDVDMDEL
ncbi:unnamed protein product [Amoebophrya sp. A120]|nr:unnamed protein product [Amoebophrya sp. A120]|eukprot:GSA120T00022319001.1